MPRNIRAFEALSAAPRRRFWGREGNTKDSVDAAALGLLAHLSGRDERIDPTRSSADDKAALAKKSQAS